MAAREAALNGDVEAAKKLEGYRTGWAKAATAQQEYTDAAEKARRSAAHNTADWLSECQQEARTTLAAQQREDASREMHAARDALGAAIQERKEREAGSLDERIRALDSQMADLENQIVEAYERGLDEDTLEALDTQMSEMAARQEELAERRNAGPGAADGQRAGETPGPQEAPNAQEEAARQEDEWAEAAREEADALRPVWRRLQSTPVYVDAAQASGILHKTGLSSIRQVNTRYGLKLRTDASRQRPDLSLDSLWNDLAGQAGGYMDAQSAHPEEALIDLMERSQAALGEADMAPYPAGGDDSLLRARGGHGRTGQPAAPADGPEMVTAPLADGVRALYDRPNGLAGDLKPDRRGRARAAGGAARADALHREHGGLRHIRRKRP